MPLNQGARVTAATGDMNVQIGAKASCLRSNNTVNIA